MARAYVALGSNVGDREGNLRAALQHLGATPRVEALRCSSLYETAPVGGPAQRNYVNAVAAVDTDLSPEQLMAAMLRIEQRLGRERTERWGPRTMDLDLLLYDDIVAQTPDLTVPHPRMHERRFVLEPLVEIAPRARHPILCRTATELLQALPEARVEAWVRRLSQAPGKPETPPRCTPRDLA